MSPAASFGERWALDNLTRKASPEEVAILDLFPTACDGDETEAAKRARKYYLARGPGGLTELWHQRRPDDEDILSSCQDVLKEDPTPGEEIVLMDVCDLQPAHLKNHFRGTYWKDFAWCMKAAYPHRISEVHIINTHKLKTISLLLLHISMYPWRRKARTYASVEGVANLMGPDYFPPEGLPYEYGGKAGAMKDLNDEWTKKLLLNAKWLQHEERKFYQTELKPELRTKNRSVRNLLSISSYDISRSQSCKSLDNDLDEGPHGAYRTLKVDRTFYI